MQLSPHALPLLQVLQQLLGAGRAGTGRSGAGFCGPGPRLLRGALREDVWLRARRAPVARAHDRQHHQQRPDPHRTMVPQFASGSLMPAVPRVGMLRSPRCVSGC